MSEVCSVHASQCVCFSTCWLKDVYVRIFVNWSFLCVHHSQWSSFHRGLIFFFPGLRAVMTLLLFNLVEVSCFLKFWTTGSSLCGILIVVNSQLSFFVLYSKPRLMYTSVSFFRRLVRLENVIFLWRFIPLQYAVVKKSWSDNVQS